jgi:prolyl 4-hydroxylase
MSAMIRITPDLRHWILNNLDRGCADATLVASMVEQQFDPTIARSLVHAFALARTQGVAPPEAGVDITLTLREPPVRDAYIYEAPRLPAGHHIHTHDRMIPVLMRLARPALAVLGAVLSAEECAQLIALARARLRASTVVDPASGRDSVAAHRDSEGMFFALNETPFIAALDRRIAEAMGCPIDHGEGLQVLRYGAAARSTPHFDFLVPQNDANRASIARSGQRVASMVVYLNDVVGGGETTFPELGLAVAPQRGNAVCFEYANSAGQLDHATLHAGAPVTSGEKWALTKWMRSRPFVPA